MYGGSIPLFATKNKTAVSSGGNLSLKKQSKMSDAKVTIKPKNPPAFPLCLSQDDFNEGMSLRDYFAAKAIVTSDSIVEEWSIGTSLACIGLDSADKWDSKIHYPKLIANVAYAIADEMLAYREKEVSND